MTQELSTQLYASVKDGSAKLLTYGAAKELKGKRIATIYFGYRGQNGLDEFIVGDILPKEPWIPNYEPFVGQLLTIEGQRKHIIHYMLGNHFFSGSDSDREVYYIELQ
jgi:hypothetical protein